MRWRSVFRLIFKVMLGVGMLAFTGLYPFILRDWIFDNIPRYWTLNSFKSSVLILLFAVASLSALVFLVIPLRRLEKFQLEYKLVSLIALSLSVTIALTSFFWQRYSNDRSWITASYLSETQQEIEMQTIGNVMEESEILGFHYRALFLKFFQCSFLPIGLVLSMLFMTLGEFFQGRDIRLSLATSWLLLLAFLNFGFLLYG